MSSLHSIRFAATPVAVLAGVLIAAQAHGRNAPPPCDSACTPIVVTPNPGMYRYELDVIDGNNDVDFQELLQLLAVWSPCT